MLKTHPDPKVEEVLAELRGDWVPDTPLPADYKAGLESNFGKTVYPKQSAAYRDLHDIDNYPTVEDYEKRWAREEAERVSKEISARQLPSGKKAS